jgi:phenylpropionate dioxygenase-like ring-hydroxylating dioxygenase large terminal subunit
MPLSALQPGLQPFTLLGENIVLFLDEAGAPAALRDRCCHRTARLSKGGCKNGNIQCGHHGWVYNRSGRVVEIPQYPPEREIPPDYRITAYACQARYGYAWVALEDPVADIPEAPEFDAPGWRTIFQFYETWNTSPTRALENSFDSAHFSFVHRATFGVAASPAPSKYELVENEQGFYAETVIDVVNPEKFQRISGVKEPSATCATPTTSRSRADPISSIQAGCATSSSTPSPPSTTAACSCASGCFATTPKQTAQPRC